LILPLLAAAATPDMALAGGGYCWYCPFADCRTHYAWHRTWHGPNTLATPLTGYFIPRKPGVCEFDDCAVDCGDFVAQSYMILPTDGDCQTEGCEHGCPAPCVVEASGLERLGQIPNDLELSVGGPSATPSGAGR
jgi:hypothetical protein